MRRGPSPSLPVPTASEQLVDLVRWWLDPARSSRAVMTPGLATLTQQGRIHVVAKYARRNVDPIEKQFVQNLRSQTGRHQSAAVLGQVDTMKDVLEQNRV